VKLVVRGGAALAGSVNAPPSKSHTHRAILLAALAEGTSVLRGASVCDDCRATADACRAMGASISGADPMFITGLDGSPKRSGSDVDVGGSGTTIRLMSAAFALAEGATTLTGGPQIRNRQMQPLLDALAGLGAPRARSLRGDGRPPVCVGGPLSGGSASLSGDSSQFASALLMACPLAGNDSEISVAAMNSRPYAVMTLEHLGRSGARVYERNLEHFFVPGGQRFRAADYRVPGDWSSAAFVIAAGMLTGSEIRVEGLDQNDVQGDKMFPEYMEGILSGRIASLDLRDHPDLLPLLAVVACSAPGTVELTGAAHARMKESDRISSICAELRRMGAAIEELPGGLRTSPSRLRGAEVDSHSDHRIAMALAVAGLSAEGKTIIAGAESTTKSYPGFAADLAALGADVKEVL
jgi:3-phosphoshikimate 1-carboxyvinyltransferase